MHLARYYPDVFEVVNDWDFSLDSPFPEEHNRNRGAKLYDLVLQGIGLCTELRASKCIIMCAMNWNMSEGHAQALIQVASEHQTEIRINTLRPTEPRHFQLLPTPSQYFKFFHHLIRYTNQLVMGDPILAVLCGVQSQGCLCGITSMQIRSKTPEGTVPVSPCVYLHELKTGDLLKDNIIDIVNSPSFQEMHHRRKAVPIYCRELDCEFLETCRGGCAARALLINKSLNEPDPYCPKIAVLSEAQIPEFPQKPVVEHGVRVHENYLCTWIGEPNLETVCPGQTAKGPSPSR
jgi:radical SAM protein with 4Fe4S-binding SPASM domain